MNIYATLHTSPTICNKAHEIIYITRGASAELVFPVAYRIEDIEQLTITFKQGKTLDWYSMFDTVTEEVEGETLEKTVLDPHFYVFNDDEYASIIFNLDSEETKQFKPNINIEYEVAIKLNTDSLASLGGKDSMIIEPQYPIAVVDSLYSRI